MAFIVTTPLAKRPSSPRILARQTATCAQRQPQAGADGGARAATVLAGVSAGLLLGLSAAGAIGLPSLPSLPSLPNLPSVPGLPSLHDGDEGSSAVSGSDSVRTKAGGGLSVEESGKADDLMARLQKKKVGGK